MDTTIDRKISYEKTNYRKTNDKKGDRPRVAVSLGDPSGVGAEVLLKALTDFWDIIRGGCGSFLRDFGNQDLMRGLIAGVRFLLVMLI